MKVLLNIYNNRASAETAVVAYQVFFDVDQEDTFDITINTKTKWYWKQMFTTPLWYYKRKYEVYWTPNNETEAIRLRLKYGNLEDIGRKFDKLVSAFVWVICEK